MGPKDPWIRQRQCCQPVQKDLRWESSASPRTPLPQDDGREERLASKRHKMRCNPFVKQIALVSKCVDYAKAWHLEVEWAR